MDSRIEKKGIKDLQANALVYVAWKSVHVPLSQIENFITKSHGVFYR